MPNIFETKENLVLNFSINNRLVDSTVDCRLEKLLILSTVVE